MKTLNEYMMQTSNFHSTQLNEYCKANLINEYLSTHVDASKVDNLEFPQKPSVKAIVDFLSNNGFKEIPIQNNDAYKSILGANELMFEDCFTQCYSKVIEAYYLAFHAKGEISAKNPVFVFSWPDNGQSYKFYTEWPRKDGHATEANNLGTYEKFVDTVNKFFNWT